MPIIYDNLSVKSCFVVKVKMCKKLIQKNKNNTNKQMENQNKQKNNICIPRMENNIDKKQIFNIFKKLNIGYIEKIIEIPLKNDNEYKRVIIKIKWNNNEETQKIKTRLQNGEPVNIVYELPWFWKIVLCNNK